MPAFFARITNAGYAQYPDLMVVTPLQGFSPGSPPPRPRPEPPLGIWGPGFPYPDQGLPEPPLGIWGPNDPRPGWGLPEPEPPQPPLGIWGPTDPRPTHPIWLPAGGAVPPSWLGQLPSPGEPGSPSNPYPPGSDLPVHPSTGLNTFYMVIPYVGVVGPFTVPPGVGHVPEAPPAVPTTPPQAP